MAELSASEQDPVAKKAPFTEGVIGKGKIRGVLLPYYCARRLTAVLLGFAFILSGCSRKNEEAAQIESLLLSLDPAARAGQLVIMTASPYPDNVDSGIEQVLAAGAISGVWIERGTPEAVAHFTRSMPIGFVPLLIGADLDEGVGGSIGSGTSFPPTNTLLLTGEIDEVREVGRTMAIEARALGIQTGLVRAPPTQGGPRFAGVDAAALSEGLSVLLEAAAEEDVPLALQLFWSSSTPGISTWDLARLKTFELPMLTVARQHASALLVGPLQLPALAGDTLPISHSRASLNIIRREGAWSAPIIVDLRNRPDSLVANAAIEAIATGADLVIVPGDPAPVITALIEASGSERLPAPRVEEAVRRVLSMKLRLARTAKKAIPPDSIATHLPNAEASTLADELAQRLATRLDTLTLAADSADILLLSPLGRGRAFAAALEDLPTIRDLPLNLSADSAALIELLRSEMSSAGTVIYLDFPQSEGVLELRDLVHAARDTTGSTRIIPIVFQNAAGDTDLDDHPLIVAQGLGAPSQRAAASLLMNAAEPKPATYQSKRLRLVVANEVDMSEAGLQEVDKVIESAIGEGVFTAAALAVGRRGALVRLRGYGTVGDSLTADDADARAVDPEATLFDLASVTKVVGTTTAAALLVEAGRLELDAPVRQYIREFRGENKEKVTIRNLLTHTSGLPPGLGLYRSANSREEGLTQVIQQPLRRPPGERMEYSDLGMILLAEVLERAGGRPLDQLLAEKLFVPLNMSATMFLPPLALREVTAPTAITTERPFPLRGIVHDGNAYRLGGRTGHAGLFSTAWDLAVFAQMWLDEGIYDGVRLLADSTVSAFTALQSDAENRALGWDTPAERSSAGRYLTSRAYGHTGYTGTSIWIDPAYDLFVVFLTNRTYTEAQASEILDARIAVHEGVARAITGDRVTARPGSR